MCEHCGCQALTPIGDLTWEHEEQDGFFSAALASLYTADWEAMEEIRARVGSLLPSPA